MFNDNEEILSVIFLAFLAIITASLMHKFIDNTMIIVPSMVFIGISLWISYDYILRNRTHDKLECYKRSNRCSCNNQEGFTISGVETQPNKDIPHIVKEPYDHVISDEALPIDNMRNILPPTMVNVHADTYSNDTYDISMEKDPTIYNTNEHVNYGCLADNRIFNRSKYTAIQPEVASKNRQNWGVNTFKRFFVDELNDQEHRVWWESDGFLDKI